MPYMSDIYKRLDKRIEEATVKRRRQAKPKSAFYVNSTAGWWNAATTLNAKPSLQLRCEALKGGGFAVTASIGNGGMTVRIDRETARNLLEWLGEALVDSGEDGVASRPAAPRNGLFALIDYANNPPAAYTTEAIARIARWLEGEGGLLPLDDISYIVRRVKDKLIVAQATGREPEPEEVAARASLPVVESWIANL